MYTVELVRLIEKMNLENCTPEIDIKSIKISQPDVNRPALQLAGFYDHFDRACGAGVYATAESRGAAEYHKQVNGF